MALRKDELFVVEKLAALHGAGWREGENPPDAYLKIGSEEIALEVTQLTESVINENGEVEVRRTQDTYGMRVALEMEKALNGAIPADRCLFLHIAVPIEAPKKFKPALEKALREYLSKRPPVGEGVVLEIGPEKVEVQLFQRDAPAERAIGAMVSNKNANANILDNAVYALRDRLSEKEEICAPLPNKGPRWLGLFNDYWLADEKTYQMALAKVEVTHGFERIYLVSDNGVIYSLHGGA